jgi:ribonucleoside-diphosphate reductase alpha chain
VNVNKNTIRRIRKRDASLVPFAASRIENAIFKALSATKTGDNELTFKLTQKVIEVLQDKFGKNTPGVEDIQDIVEKVLMTQGYPAVAKAYILYQEEHADMRRLKKAIGVKDDLKPGINALKVLERRYLLRDPEGNLMESPRELFHRVAHSIASIETRFDPSLISMVWSKNSSI